MAGDMEFLADADHIAAQAVGLFECANSCAVVGGDMAECVAFFYDVRRCHLCPAWAGKYAVACCC